MTAKYSCGLVHGVAPVDLYAARVEPLHSATTVFRGASDDSLDLRPLDAIA